MAGSGQPDCQGLKERDFSVKSESVSQKMKGKREYLNNSETRRMMKELEGYFESKVEISLIRHGNKQRIETLINEEALLLTKYLKGETQTWIPRVVRERICVSDNAKLFLYNEKCPSVLILEMPVLFQPQPTEPFEAHF